MMKRLVSPEGYSGESDIWRPLTLKHFVGQSAVKENLSIFIQAALAQKRTLDHVLLSGPPGLGKTSLAQIIAWEMGSVCRITSGPVLMKVGDLAAVLTQLNAGDILFIDEIHRLPRAVEETLYPALDLFTLDLPRASGPGAQCLRLNLERFTLVGATTRSGLLSNPLRGRFGIPIELNWYNPEELGCIVQQAAEAMNLTLDLRSSHILGARSRGTPRTALRLLRRVADFAVVANSTTLTPDIIEYALKRLEVDHVGLDNLDRKYLKRLFVTFQGGPVGLETLAAGLGLEVDTLTDVVEPYLLQQGLIARSQRGRMLTSSGQAYCRKIASEENL